MLHSTRTLLHIGHKAVFPPFITITYVAQGNLFWSTNFGGRVRNCSFRGWRKEVDRDREWQACTAGDPSIHLWLWFPVVIIFGIAYFPLNFSFLRVWAALCGCWYVGAWSRDALVFRLWARLLFKQAINGFGLIDTRVSKWKWTRRPERLEGTSPRSGPEYTENEQECSCRYETGKERKNTKGREWLKNIAQERKSE